MKESDVPQISATWWRRNKPATLPATGLGDALQSYQTARGKAVPTKEVGKFEAVIEAYEAALTELKSLDGAVSKAVGKCNKVVHAACIKVLKKFDSLLDKERAQVESELKSYRDLLSNRVEKVEQDCKTILASMQQDVKPVAAKLAALEQVERDAADNLELAAHAVADRRPNAGESELTYAQSFESDAVKLLGAIKTLVEKSQKETQKAWADAYDKTLKCIDQKRMNALADRYCNAEAPLEVALTRAEDKLDSIRKLTKSVRELADGAGDLRDHFVSICNGLAERMIKEHAMVSASLREIGGKFDAAGFDVMNFCEEKDLGRRDPELLLKSNGHLTSGLEMLMQAKKRLGAAQASFEQSQKSFPDFVVSSDTRFKEPLKQLSLVAESLQDDDAEAKKLAEKAVKTAASLKTAMKMGEEAVAQ